ncbi:MAG TPA: hypothetical protein VFD92_06035 [Candidatus Binatia bacterium]|nr:hypothetical protein [Candidatus Binatia bacterium]
MTSAIAAEGRSRFVSIAFALIVATLPATSLAAVRVKAPADGRMLTITGNSAADDVTVAFDAQNGAIDVTANGMPVGQYPAGSLEVMRIRLGGGNDSLGVQLFSNGLLHLRMLDVNLGGGDDFAMLRVDPTVMLSVNGAGGHDTVNYLGDTSAFRSVELIASAIAMVNNGGGTGGLGYSCSGSTCTCDKSIENDCEDMSGICTDDTVDALITCINGWLTTHCVCTKAMTVQGTDFLNGAVLTGGVLTRVAP